MVAAKLTSPWQSTAFIEVVNLTILGGVTHNAARQLCSGLISEVQLPAGRSTAFATTGSDPANSAIDRRYRNDRTRLSAQIGGTVSQTRLGEVAVSPDNSEDIGDRL